MGLIRKTLSISTLGVVNWRSKKERLREANEQLELTRADLEQATQKHALIRERLLDAQRRVDEAELSSISESRKARRAGRRSVTDKVGRRTVALATLKNAVTPLIESANDARHRVAAEVEPAVDDALSTAREQSKKARAEAEKTAGRLRKKTRKAAEHAKARAAELSS